MKRRDDAMEFDRHGAPSPSSITAPSQDNKASIRRHLMFDRTGCSKIAANVLSCLPIPK